MCVLSKRSCSFRAFISDSERSCYYAGFRVPSSTFACSNITRLLLLLPFASGHSSHSSPPCSSHFPCSYVRDFRVSLVSQFARIFFSSREFSFKKNPPNSTPPTPFPASVTNVITHYFYYSYFPITPITYCSSHLLMFGPRLGQPNHSG
jgi:hypothetical protein